MTQIHVVIDTYVFNRTLIPGGRYREVLETVIRLCHRIVVNTAMMREYREQAYRAGITPELILRVLEHRELLPLGKLRRTANTPRRRAFQGISDQDQPFVEAARASHSQFLITTDRNIHQHKDDLQAERITVIQPEDYITRFST